MMENPSKHFFFVKLGYEKMGIHLAQATQKQYWLSEGRQVKLPAQ